VICLLRPRAYLTEKERLWPAGWRKNAPPKEWNVSVSIDDPLLRVVMVLILSAFPKLTAKAPLWDISLRPLGPPIPTCSGDAPLGPLTPKRSQVRAIGQRLSSGLSGQMR
jgi:hypothetical protein